MRDRGRVYVTQEDIDKGKPCSPGWCPISLAIRRRFPKWWSHVGTVDVCMKNEGGGQLVELTLSKSASNFVGSFDRGGPSNVSPFSFMLDIP